MISVPCTFMGLNILLLSILCFILDVIAWITLPVNVGATACASATIGLLPFSIPNGVFTILVFIAAVVSLMPAIIMFLIGAISICLACPSIVPELSLEVLSFALTALTAGGLCAIPTFIPCLGILYLPIGIEIFLMYMFCATAVFFSYCIFVNIYSSLCVCVTLNISIILSIALLFAAIAETCLATCFVINVLTVTGGTGGICVIAMFVVLAIISFIFIIICITSTFSSLLCPFLSPIFCPLLISTSVIYFVCFMSVFSCFPPAALPFFCIAFTGAFTLGCVCIPILVLVTVTVCFGTIILITSAFSINIFTCICIAESVIFAVCNICTWCSTIIMGIVLLLLNLITFLPALIATFCAGLILASIVATVILIGGLFSILMLTMGVTIISRIIGGGS